MTEAEWLSSTEPTPMLGFLRGVASDRKLRLFACACCRHVWHLLGNDGCRRAVELSERFADDPSAAAEMGAVCDEVLAMDTDWRGVSHAGRRGAAYKAAAYSSCGRMWHVETAGGAGTNSHRQGWCFGRSV